MTIKAKISRVEPTTEYQGAVYDQNVVIELPSGKELGIFDLDMLVEEGMIGNTKEFQISLLVGNSSIKPCSNVEPHVEPSSENPEFWKNHVYFGEVRSLSAEQDHYVISLDIGEGHVFVQTKEETFPIPEIGNGLRIEASRSDIHGVD